MAYTKKKPTRAKRKAVKKRKEANGAAIVVGGTLGGIAGAGLGGAAGAKLAGMGRKKKGIRAKIKRSRKKTGGAMVGAAVGGAVGAAAGAVAGRATLGVSRIAKKIKSVGKYKMSEKHKKAISNALKGKKRK